MYSMSSLTNGTIAISSAGSAAIVFASASSTSVPAAAIFSPVSGCDHIGAQRLPDQQFGLIAAAT